MTIRGSRPVLHRFIMVLRCALIILCGLPGVGKLTVSRQLAAITGFGNFHNHLVVDALLPLFPFGSVPFRELRERIWLEVLTRAAQDGVDGAIFTFAYDRTVTPTFLIDVARRVGQHGTRTSCFELTCEAAELHNRLAAPDRAAFNKLALDGFLQLERDGAFPRPPLPPDTTTIDTTGSDPVGVAQAIASRIRTTAAH
jgi:hypothetical protein